MDGLMCFVDKQFLKELKENIRENRRDKFPLFIGKILKEFMEEMKWLVLVW